MGSWGGYTHLDELPVDYRTMYEHLWVWYLAQEFLGNALKVLVLLLAEPLPCLVCAGARPKSPPLLSLIPNILRYHRPSNRTILLKTMGRKRVTQETHQLLKSQRNSFMSPAQSVLESWRGVGLAQGFSVSGAGVVCLASHPDTVHHASFHLRHYIDYGSVTDHTMRR